MRSSRVVNCHKKILKKQLTALKHQIGGVTDDVQIKCYKSQNDLSRLRSVRVAIGSRMMGLTDSEPRKHREMNAEEIVGWTEKVEVFQNGGE